MVLTALSVKKTFGWVQWCLSKSRTTTNMHHILNRKLCLITDSDLYLLLYSQTYDFINAGRRFGHSDFIEIENDFCCLCQRWNLRIFNVADYIKNQHSSKVLLLNKNKMTYLFLNNVLKLLISSTIWLSLYSSWTHFRVMRWYYTQKEN